MGWKIVFCTEKHQNTNYTFQFRHVTFPVIIGGRIQNKTNIWEKHVANATTIWEIAVARLTNKKHVDSFVCNRQNRLSQELWTSIPWGERYGPIDAGSCWPVIAAGEKQKANRSCWNEYNEPVLVYNGLQERTRAMEGVVYICFRAPHFGSPLAHPNKTSDKHRTLNPVDNPITHYYGRTY